MRRLIRALGAIAGVSLLMAACGAGSEGGADPDPDRRGPQGRLAQFVVRCELSHVAFDDPIVLPWQPGKSHQHQFFGNVETGSDPSYGSAVGAETSCEQRRDTASYWAPTLLDGTGRRVEPHGMTAYYRPGDGVDPADVVAYPAGMMIIGGDASADDPQPIDVVAWSCGSGAIREQSPPACAPGSTLRLLVTFPDCWDGNRLTAFGSGAHVRYSEGGCPESHPIAMPQLLMAIDYPAVDPAELSLSSGSIETAHADFWNVWDQEKLEQEVAMCLNRDLVCGVTG